MVYVEEATIIINFPKLTDIEDCKPMFETIEKIITQETGVTPKIECIGVKK